MQKETCTFVICEYKFVKNNKHSLGYIIDEK